MTTPGSRWTVMPSGLASQNSVCTGLMGLDGSATLTTGLAVQTEQAE